MHEVPLREEENLLSLDAHQIPFNRAIRPLQHFKNTRSPPSRFSLKSSTGEPPGDVFQYGK